MPARRPRRRGVRHPQPRARVDLLDRGPARGRRSSRSSRSTRRTRRRSRPGATTRTRRGSRSRSAATTRARSASCRSCAAPRSAGGWATSCTRSRSSPPTASARSRCSARTSTPTAATSAPGSTGRSSPTCCARSTRSTASSGSGSRRRTRRTCVPRRSRRWPSARRCASTCTCRCRPGATALLARMHRGYTAERYLERLAARARRDPRPRGHHRPHRRLPGRDRRRLRAHARGGRRRRVRRRVHLRVLAAARARPRPRWPTTSCRRTSRSERMQRLVEVVERHALAQHEARVGRVEEVLVEGPSKKRPEVVVAAAPARTSSCTSQPTAASVGRASRARSGSPAPRRTGSAAISSTLDAVRIPRAHPVAAACVTHLALVGAHRVGQVRRSRSPLRTRSATSRSCRSTRCRCTAGSTSARRSRRSRERAAVPHHLHRRRRPVGRLVGGALPDRGARRGRRHRVARQARAARRRHRPLPAGSHRSDSRSRPRTSRCAPSSKREVTDPEGLAAAYAELERVDPVAAARIEPGNRAPHRARARGDRHHRPSVLVVRAGHAVLRRHGVPRVGGRVSAADRRARRAASSSASRRCATPAWSTRSVALAARGDALPHRPPGDRVQGGARLPRRGRTVARRCARRGGAPHASASPAARCGGSGGIPASPGWKRPRIPAMSLPSLLALWSR